MPKKSKRKKRQQQLDFKKPKLKVGKKKTLPANHTNISFKSKAIILPNQSINEDKSHELTNSRNLTLNDLVTQLRHYSANVRKDALLGLKDLFNRYPQILPGSLSLVINAIVKLLVDEDATLRRILLSFMNEFIPMLSESDFRPFLPLLIIYTCSAMTHIHEDIRTDAIKYLDIWLNLAPDVVTNGFWKKILPNYVSMLGSDMSLGQTGMSGVGTSSLTFLNPRSQILSQETRIKILASFENFLKAGMLKGEDTLKLIFISFLRSQQARNSFMNQDTRRQKRNVVDWVACHGKVNTMPLHPLTLILMPQLSSSPIQPTLGLFSHSISSSQDSKDDKMSMSTVTLKSDRSVHTKQAGAMEIEYDTATVEGRIAITQTIITTLHQLLLSTWLDTAPIVFGSITSTIYQSPGLLLLNHILRILDVLWRAFFIESREKSDARKLWTDPQTQQLLKHITIHFPYGAGSFGMRDAKTESILREMNVICCNLVVIYLLDSSILSSENDHEDSSSMMPKTTSDAVGGRLSWAGRVFDYIIVTLGGGTESILLEHEIRDKMKLTPTDFKPEHLTSLLPSIWGLLNCIDDNDQILLYQTLIEYGKQSHAQSSTKRIIAGFVSRSLMLQNSINYTGRFRISRSLKLMSITQSWLLSLPKLLWELKTGSLEATEEILAITLDITKGRVKGIVDDEVLNQLQTALVPFLFVMLPNKGPVFGPFMYLPQDIQRTTIEIIYYFPSLNDKMMVALEQVLKREEVNEHVKIYAANILKKFHKSHVL
ncbi:8604_t:CDS:10 [Paraglomus brasilianum]|uniref:Pre-rRNA-processing protein n=1 Tax=Paraglomus brasilianum TaxID=144538 RepID=A0A9N9CGD9_9GLOM|nr:8604_t:CDS:10 [Paraglomus brasilianum]